MSQIVVPDCGKTRIGNRAMKATYSPIDGHATFRLYKNMASLSAATVAGDLTEMTAGDLPGYAAAALTGATDGGIDGNDRDTWTWPTLNFTASSSPGSPATAYGYFVTSNDDGTLLWVQAFDSPFTWSSTGDTLPVVPQFSFGEID